MPQVVLTTSVLRAMWPRATQRKIEAVAGVSQRVFVKYGLTSAMVVAHCMAQISHENSAGTATRENMNYTNPDRLMAVFGVGKHSAAITRAEALSLAGKPEQIAERVYGLGNPRKAKELGNTQPGDGFRYRGNGDLQTTGRAGHHRVAGRTGFDIERDPGMLTDPAVSFEVAVAEFAALGCIKPASADNIGGVTKLVNGGSNGLAERKVWLRRWKGILDGVDEPVKLPRGADPQAPKPLMQSKIAQGTAVSVGLGVMGTGAQVATYVQTASDTVTAAKGAADSAGVAIETVKPLLGMPAGFWMGVAIFCAVAAIVAAVYALRQRQNKLYDEGV